MKSIISNMHLSLTYIANVQSIALICCFVVLFFSCEEGTELSADKKIDQLVLTVGGADTPVTFDADYNASLTVPFGTDLTAITIKTLQVSAKATTSVPQGGVLLLTGSSAMITVTAENGSKQIYTIQVTIVPRTTAPLRDADITALTATISGQAYSTTGDNPLVAIRENTISITLPLLFGSTLPTRLSLTGLTLSAGASSVPAQGATLDLTAAGIGMITVTAEDGTTTRVYTVQVTIATDPLMGADITTLTATIAGQAYSSTGDNPLVAITDDNIAIMLPFGNSLPSSLSLTVLTLSPGASSIPAQGATLSLTAAGEGTITVTAEDGVAMGVYVVRVTIMAPRTGATITTLTATIAAGQVYSSTGDNPLVTITDNNIAIMIPFGSTLPSSLSLTVLTLSPGASSIPAQGATLSLTAAGEGTITVTAEDGVAMGVYAVRVTIMALRTGATITTLTATIAGQVYSSTGDNPLVTITGESIAIMIPFGDPLPSSLLLTVLTLSPGASSTPAQGATLTLTAGAGMISVQAEDPSVAASSYTVSLTTAQPLVTTYTGTDTLGIAVRDVVEAGRSLSFSATDAVVTVSGLSDVSVDWTLGTLRGTKTATAGMLVLTQSDLAMFPATADATYTLTVTANGRTSEGKTLFYYPGQVRTWRDLQGMRVDLAGTYRLMNDVSFPDENNDGASEYNFEPLGRDTDANADEYQGTPFSGTFDGAAHEIRNLYINRSAEDYVGLFGNVTDGTVSNIGLVGGTVTGANQVGGLVGSNMGTITGVYATVTMMAGGNTAGGLVGGNTGTVTGAYATGTVVAGGNTAGGLVGRNTGTIQGAYATGAVQGGFTAGGLVGVNTGTGTVRGAYATGAVMVENSGAGGLAGANTFRGTIESVYATGAATGSSNVGGLVGNNFSGTLVGGYARGNVTRIAGSTSTTLGRLVGNQLGTAFGYYSGQPGESQLLNAAAGGSSTALTGARGYDGVASRTKTDGQVSFASNRFVFGSEIGQWIFTAGRWPALYLGDLQSAAEQPTQ